MVTDMDNGYEVVDQARQIVTSIVVQGYGNAVAVRDLLLDVGPEAIEGDEVLTATVVSILNAILGMAK